MVALVLLAACGSGNGPDPVLIEGTWIGAYTNSNTPGITFEGVLQVVQDNDQVFGTFTSNAGRAADVLGDLNGQRFTATFTYTDGCEGTAEMTADIVGSPERLVGNYTSSDCVGETTGGFNLAKQ
jgi:hypothetical protein